MSTLKEIEEKEVEEDGLDANELVKKYVVEVERLDALQAAAATKARRSKLTQAHTPETAAAKCDFTKAVTVFHTLKETFVVGPVRERKSEDMAARWTKCKTDLEVFEAQYETWKTNNRAESRRFSLLLFILNQSNHIAI